jgi:transmembrane sensor
MLRRAQRERLMSIYTRQRGSLAEEAQRWDRVLKNGGPAERAAFASWIKRSPQHLEAYLQHLAIETEVQRLDADGNFDVEALLAKAPTNVVQLVPGIQRTTAALLPASGRRNRWRLFGAIAATGLLAACLILARFLSGPQWTDYTTATGEQRRVVLPDGTSIELNTQSHIRVSFRPKSREVDLLAGEVLFNVQHDSTRPFRVRARDKVIEDLGTQFSIYLRPDASTTVSVLDGRVQILSDASAPIREAAAGSEAVSDGRKPARVSRSTQLSAGEEAHIAAGGRLIKRAKINVAEAAPWREHRLWFEGASLPEVAAEFNRYNKRQIRIGDGDAALLKRRYTASFDAYDPESFVQALRDDPTLTVQSNDEGMLIQAR